MTRQVEFFWVEFMFSCLPEVVKNFYTDMRNQKDHHFQSFEEENALWVRYAVPEDDWGNFKFRVFHHNWINLPYALHQEWDCKQSGGFEEEEEGIDYLKIGGYRVTRYPIMIGYDILLGDQTWKVDLAVWAPMTFPMYCISPHQSN